MKKYSKYGFTLLELLVTIAIIAILGTIAIPSLTTIYTKQKEISASQQMLGIFRMARQEAIATRSNISVVVNTNTTHRLVTVTRSDSSIVTQQQIDSSGFLSSFVGLRAGQKTLDGSVQSFGFTSVGIPFAKNAGGSNEVLASNQSIVGYFSTTQQTFSINNNSTVGFIITANGLGYICKNSTDAQVKNRCNR